MRSRSQAIHRRLIDAAYDSFWRVGFTRSNVDTIAARARVTKRTLYGHFRSKDDLLAAVLEHYNESIGQRLDTIGAGLPVTRAPFIDAFFGQLAAWASTTPRWTGSGLTRLVMELADMPGHPARQMARRSKSTSEAWLARRLGSAHVRRSAEHAREMMILMEGAMVLTLMHGDRRYLAAAAKAAKKLTGQARP